MTEKIVILGNGFDLRHYLPTKYDHLITILREIESLDFDTTCEINFEKLFGSLFKENDEWFYEKIKEYYVTSKINFDKNELKSIQDRIKTNNWFQYLKSVEDNKIETWIDFEIEIERVLKLILSYFDHTSKGIFKYPSYTLSSSTGDNFYFFHYESEKFISNNLQINILKFFKLFQLDNDGELVVINNDYILNIEGKIQYYKEKYFFDFVYKSLEEFTGVFNDYIEKIVNTFYENFKEEKKESFIKVNNDFLFDKISKVYCFNYTNTYLNLYRYKDTIKKAVRNLPRANKFKGIEFLHGKSIVNWEGNVENLEIVLGVNDIDPLLKNHKLFQFTKYFQKLHKGTDYLFLDKIIQTLKRPTKGMMDYSFYFWGHSLDLSDKEYIIDVFKIVNETQSRIIIFYHSISGKADQLKNLLNIIDKNIIENMMKNERLVFIESTPENLFEEL